MIRYSETKDLKDIITLWCEAFEDSESDIMFFINAHYKPQNTLVFEENGKIASMLFLLEGEMHINGKLYPSYYLYAACTLNEYRGRGYMSLLLEFAKETAIMRGFDYICLLPAEKSLYGYYEKFGYKTIFKNKIIYLNRDEIKSQSSTALEDVSQKADLRNRALSGYNYFKWNNSAVDFAFRHTIHYGGKVAISRKGYMLYSVSEREISVKENAFTDVFFNELSRIITLYPFVEKIIVNLPYDFDISTQKTEIVDHGMILAVNPKAEDNISGINNAYLGLTLD